MKKKNAVSVAESNVRLPYPVPEIASHNTKPRIQIPNPPFRYSRIAGD